VEAATERTWMGESCIHDVGFWHSQQQLARSNRGVASVLRDLALVGCRIELAELSENIGWKGKALKNALRAVFGGDQSMGSSLVELYQLRQSMPTPLRVDQASHLLQPRYSGPDHVIDGRLTAEKEIVVRLRNPAIRQFVGKKDVQGLINSDEVGDKICLHLDELA